MEKEIHFGERIKICFPNGDFFFIPAENITDIVCGYYEAELNGLLNDTNIHSEAYKTYQKRRKIAEKYIKDSEV